ncbi:MAG: DUF4884 domain-containing protein [Flavobacteriaceae bacterium]
MNTSVYVFIGLVCMIMVACSARRPISRTPAVNNDTYRVEYLFEHEGCKIYRFRDAGNFVYLTKCKGELTNVESDSSRVTNIIR